MTGSRVEDEVQFTLSYVGPQLDSGRMDVAALAPAMLSMARLIEDSARLTYGSATTVKLEVVADFRRGSFSFDVVAIGSHVAQQLAQHGSVEHLLTVLGLGPGMGLFQFIKWLRNRKITTAEQRPGHMLEVRAEDGSSISIHAETLVLAQNSTVRVDLSGVVDPLRRDGVTEFRAGDRRRPSAVVTKDDVPSFDPPTATGTLLQDRLTTEYLEVISVSFIPTRQWRFALADGTAFGSQPDEEFRRQVAARDVRFGKGDVLLAEVRTRVGRNDAGELTAERSIVRVLRHIPNNAQLPLGLAPLESATEDGDTDAGPEPPPSRSRRKFSFDEDV